MVSLIERDEILKAARKLVPGPGFSVVPDLPFKLPKKDNTDKVEQKIM
jgi:hypothetical protein